MKRAIQKDFFSGQADLAPRRYSHGGDVSKGRRKIERPLDRERPLHLVMKSSHAEGRLSLLTLKNKTEISKIFRDRAKQFCVTIHSIEIMRDHIHAIVSFMKRGAFQNFLRTVTALTARLVTGARKGKPFGKRFWDRLAFTRVVVGRKGMAVVSNYLKKNKIEREKGTLARLAVEEFELARAKARKKGLDVWDVFAGPMLS